MLDNRYELCSLGFSTVRDYARYYSECQELLGELGDLKDVQRPWALEQVRQLVPHGQQVLDMGGSACELASILKTQYSVTVVDPYDGVGNGPSTVDKFKRRHPEVKFIRDYLTPNTDISQEYSAVVSTSVVEHIPPDAVLDDLRGIDKALCPGGFSIHAIDLSVTGDSPVKRIVDQVVERFLRVYQIQHGLGDLEAMALSDCNTFYLSPRMYLQWKKDRSWEDYPWRQVASLNVVMRKMAA